MQRANSVHDSGSPDSAIRLHLEIQGYGQNDLDASFRASEPLVFYSFPNASQGRQGSVTMGECALFG